tara:strand:- start:191 stop:439 length:249 start_codon:yes stop_codon:yes gene_type:complete
MEFFIFLIVVAFMIFGRVISSKLSRKNGLILAIIATVGIASLLFFSESEAKFPWKIILITIFLSSVYNKYRLFKSKQMKDLT